MNLFIRKPLVGIIVSLLCLCTGHRLWARPPSTAVDTTPTNRPLLLPRGTTKLAFSQHIAKSNAFYDAHRNFQSIHNLTLWYWESAAEGYYGITDFLTAGFQFPWVFYQAKDSEDQLDATTYGLSDISFALKLAGLTWRSIQQLFAYTLVFPNGATAVGTNDNRELPLGRGIISHIMGVQIRKSAPAWSLQIDGFFILRPERVVEYLVARAPDKDGVVVNFGNRKIDWGDSFFGELAFAGQLWGSLGVRITTSFLYRMNTKIDGETIAYFDSDAGTRISSGYLLSITPEVIVSPASDVDLFIRNEVPVMGKRYPIVDLYETDHLIGYISPTIGLNYYFE